MPIRPDILLTGQHLPQDTTDYAARALARRNAEAQTRVHELELSEAQKASQRQENFRTALGKGAKLEELYGIDPDLAGKFEQQRLTMNTARTTQAKSEWDLNLAKSKEVANILSGVTDGPSYHRAVGHLVSLGVMAPDAGAEMMKQPWTDETAAAMKQLSTSFQTALQRAEESRQLTKEAHDAALRPLEIRQKTAAADSAEAQLPGDRAKALAELLKTAGMSVAGMAPSQDGYTSWLATQPEQIRNYYGPMYRPGLERVIANAGMTASERATQEGAAATRAETARHNRVGERNATASLGESRRHNLVSEKNAITNKPPTNEERKNLGFFMRATEATRNLEELEAYINGMGYGAQVWHKNAPNPLQGGESQRVHQAQKAFTEARLRKESGAAIPEFEFENDRVMYFPQPGDKPENLAQKKAARRQVLRALRISSGNAVREIGEEPGDLPAEQKVTVQTPDGQKFTFDSQAQADAFKREAGIR